MAPPSVSILDSIASGRLGSNLGHKETSINGSGRSRGVPKVPRDPLFCASAEGLCKQVCPVYTYAPAARISGTPFSKS